MSMTEERYETILNATYVCRHCGARSDDLALMKKHCAECDGEHDLLAKSLVGGWVQSAQGIMQVSSVSHSQLDGRGWADGEFTLFPQAMTMMLADVEEITSKEAYRQVSALLDGMMDGEKEELRKMCGLSEATDGSRPATASRAP